VARRWFSLGISFSPPNKPDRHDISEILLKVVFDDPLKDVVRVDPVGYFVNIVYFGF
jgi:hypothetical protein